jgi:hypothetical protein
VNGKGIDGYGQMLGMDLSKLFPTGIIPKNRDRILIKKFGPNYTVS